MFVSIFHFLTLSTCLGFAFDVKRWASFRDRNMVMSLSRTSDRNDAISRRDWLASFAAACTVVGIPNSPNSLAHADEQVASSIPVEMKNFVDPQGLFSVRVPQRFFTLRRSAKGDLPDAKTGKGRRGSSIFTAGDMAKAEVVAIERFPTRILLEENGIEATGKQETFPDLGEPAAIANLINLRREKDKPGMSNSAILPDSVSVSSDGKELRFKVKAQIDVQKPELLMEQLGVDQLFRITLAKASLRASDGNMMAVFASALETDFNGPDGVALQESVDSFQANEREFGF